MSLFSFLTDKLLVGFYHTCRNTLVGKSTYYIFQTVSCDDFLPLTHARSHTRFSAARTSHARVRFAKDRIAHASRTCAVVRVRFIKIRTRTLTFLAKK